MHRRSVCLFVVLFSSLCIGTLQLAVAGFDYAATIPAGYGSRAVLHVDYGNSPAKIRVEWGHGGSESDFRSPASVTNMRVVGDGFYFIDAVADTIKLFRSPGTLVWETQPFENLGYYAVDSNGGVYLAWGAGLNNLSYLDGNGKLIWTRDQSDVLSGGKLRESGLDSWFPQFGWLEWTRYGLTAKVIGTGKDGKQHEYAVLISQRGEMDKVLPGTVVDSDGNVCEPSANIREGRYSLFPMICKSIGGDVLREVRPSFSAGKGSTPGGAGDQQIARVIADPAGGLVAESTVRLPSPVRISSRLEAKSEEVTWRLDSQGNSREQWRFPSNKFGGRASQTVIGSDGCVYHLQFGETGIDVIKYYRDKD